MTDKITRALQEDVLTLLCHDDKQGGIVANIVEARLFEGEYRVLAERAIQFWREHKQAPKSHTANLVADILEDNDNPKAKTYRRILMSMVELSESINSAYVLQKLRSFTRLQRLKIAVGQSAEQLDAMQEGAIDQVEEIWARLLRANEVTFDTGLHLTDYQKVLDFLENTDREFTTGIPIFDKRGITPMRGKVMLFLAPTGIGKSWWLVNVGKEAFKQRKKILHITLEMYAEEVMQRYYQALFAISKREEKFEIMTLEFDKLDKLSGFKKEKLKPDFAFDSDNISDELETRIELDQIRLDNCIIKFFPSASLTINALRAYLDNLEAIEHYVPDIILLDYIGEIKTDARNHRIELGRAFKEFKGLCAERGIAGVTAHQISRKGSGSARARTIHIAEDWSLVGTADIAITMTRTEAEARFGLARLFVDKARSDRDKFGVLITQNYDTGQFVLESAALTPRYDKLVEDLDDDKSDKEDPSDEGRSDDYDDE